MTADVGYVHMLTYYNARVWRRLRASWSYNELGFTNHSAFLNVAILCFFERFFEHNSKWYAEWT